MSDLSRQFISCVAFILLCHFNVDAAIVAPAAIGSNEQTAVSNNQTTSAENPAGQLQNVIPYDYYRYRIKNMFEYLEGRPDEECPKKGPADLYRFYCPTPQYNRANDWICIKIDDLCNNIPDCPGAEDEDPTHCMYYLAIQQQTRNIRQTMFKLFRRQLEEYDNVRVN